MVHVMFITLVYCYSTVYLFHIHSYSFLSLSYLRIGTLLCSGVYICYHIATVLVIVGQERCGVGVDRFVACVDVCMSFLFSFFLLLFHDNFISHCQRVIYY